MYVCPPIGVVPGGRVLFTLQRVRRKARAKVEDSPGLGVHGEAASGGKNATTDREGSRVSTAKSGGQCSFRASSTGRAGGAGRAGSTWRTASRRCSKVWNEALCSHRRFGLWGSQKRTLAHQKRKGNSSFLGPHPASPCTLWPRRASVSVRSFRRTRCSAIRTRPVGTTPLGGGVYIYIYVYI